MARGRLVARQICRCSTAPAEAFTTAGVTSTCRRSSISTAVTPQGGKRAGAAYEIVDECRHDVAAWVAWLRQRIGPRIGLVGHSMGAVKALYAAAYEADIEAAVIIAISPRAALLPTLSIL